MGSLKLLSIEIFEIGDVHLLVPLFSIGSAPIISHREQCGLDYEASSVPSESWETIETFPILVPILDTPLWVLC
jgi:hypothetical protein